MDGARRAVICLPTYDERENLAPILAAIHAAVPDVDVLVVDDDSPDGTGRLADEIAARDPRVKVLHRAGKQGLGRAYLAGFAWALERGYDLDPRDGRRLLPRPPLPARAPRGGARRRPRARVALRPGRRHGELGPRAEARLARREPLRPVHPGRLGPRPHRRVQVLPARGARGDRPRGASSAPGTPSRSSSPSARSGAASGWSRCRSSSSTGGPGSRRCRGASSSRRCARSGRCGSRRSRRAARPPAERTRAPA